MVSPAAPEDEDDGLDELLRMDPGRRAGGRKAGRDRRAGSGAGEPVRRWKASADDDPFDDEIDDRPKGRREKVPVFWRARDSLYFEPLVALAILAVLLVSLFAYTSNWPPVYVVESNSMQHGSGDHLGVLNAGDIVLAEKVPFGSIVTFEAASQTGFSTYGLLGDVILYYPNGTTSATPIIHRAILYLQYNANGSYSAMGLDRSRCGTGGTFQYFSQTTVGQCVVSDLRSPDNLTLFNVGGRTVTVNFATESVQLGAHSGFLTLGDNNTYPDQLPPSGSLFVLSTLVEPGWVIGVARGLIPWFGALKLLLDGNSNKVPTASWEFLGLTIAGVIFAGAGLHYILKRRHEEERWTQIREERREKAKDKDEPPAKPKEREKGPEPPSRPRPAVRVWKPAEPAPPAPAAATSEGSPRRMSYEQRRRAHFVSDRERQREAARRKRAEAAESAKDDDDT